MIRPRAGMKKRTVILILLLTIFILFLGWRFVRPMNIFVVSPSFERPIDTSNAPTMFQTLSAQECAACHREFYDEWATTIHSQAWTDPYFQVDWRFEDKPQVCKNCHIPLDRQQEHQVLGFRDSEKWDPILAPNPDFDAELQHEGVTCNVCHLRDGKILGVYGDSNAPHPVERIDNPNRVCVRCHVVSGERWDTFFKFPPCGTVAEIQTNQGKQCVKDVDNLTTDTIAALGCVDCHMPLLQRPLVTGGKVRATRRHLWRGGHEPAMVKQALTISFEETAGVAAGEHRFELAITNSGAAHYVPTGTPDRHLTVQLRLLDAKGKVLKEEDHLLKRTVMWRPFIIDLWDTRLPHGEQRSYHLAFPDQQQAVAVEAVVRYHLLDEKRRQRIGYENKEPIAYDVFRQRLPVTEVNL